MLISEEYKLLFVHVQKTGGSTISGLLYRNIADLKLYRAKHGFAADGIYELPGWEDLYKFAFVRNPWDRLVSWYTMINDASRIRWYQTITNKTRKKHYNQFRNNPLWRYVRENSNDFSSFIRNCTGEIAVEQGSRYSFAFNQLDYVSDRDGNTLVDFLGRFESFDKDLAVVLNNLDIASEVIPRKNVSKHDHYSNYYNAETRELIRDRFKKDIDFFGYEFESAK